MFSASGLCPWYLNNEVLCGRSVFCSGTTQLMRVSVFPKQLSLSNVWDWSSKDFFFILLTQPSVQPCLWEEDPLSLPLFCALGEGNKDATLLLKWSLIPC